MLQLADHVGRIADPGRAAERFADLVADMGVPVSLGLPDRVAARLGARMASRAPHLVSTLVSRRLRGETRGVILPADERALTDHITKRRAEGIRLNLNVLGEATIGEGEAERRLDATLAALAREDVDYVSVKISAICSQISLLAFDSTVDRISERLRRLYAAARSARPPKFVNLDMEEYHDLHLTVEAFRRVLDEPALADLDAGIALQAYLPDSLPVLQALCDWSRDRHQRAGGRIKIRIVKGANLPLERVEAEVRGWEQAPYASKHDVDANYKRLLETVLAPAYADSVRVGLASHNAFDIAWGLVLSQAIGATNRVDFEMLEGMAEGLAQAVRARTNGLRLYAPVVAEDQFDAAIAYFVRRFDENTAPGNFLPALLRGAGGRANQELETQRADFVRSVRNRHEVMAGPRRTQDRNAPRPPADPKATFSNEADTDFSLERNRRWLLESLERWTPPTTVPLVVAGQEQHTAVVRRGSNPSSPGQPTYQWSAATRPLVEEALTAGAAAAERWSASSTATRRSVLCAVASVIASQRGETIATICHETGKTVGEADPEVSEAVDFALYYAAATRTLDALEADGAHHRGGGVVVLASPWNFPYSIPAGGVLAALAAGHAVILKPAPEAVLTGWLLARQCWSAGVPRDQLQFVPCDDDDVGRHLVTHSDVHTVLLTGAHQTAQLFLRWNPHMRLRAETSGKNAVIVTAAADLDLAIRDVVRSAFGHAGQKCSAASLAIVEASVYDGETFRRRLADATRSLKVAVATDLSADVGPLVRSPSGPLERALRTVDPGEEWLVAPQELGCGGRLWSPGVKLGVQPHSWAHQTEWFGPVLGVMRADDLHDAVRLQNATRFGLTGGIHSLDPREVDFWEREVEVGNAYVNRTITGAVVRRQPFGGWKNSVVGPSAKAGGPNLVISLCDWTSASESARSLDQWWSSVFAAEEDASGLRCERNILRYRPLSEKVVIRASADVLDDDLAFALAAARVAGVDVQVSLSAPRPLFEAVVEDEEALAVRIREGSVPRLRVLGPLGGDVLALAHATGVPIDDTPVCRNGRIELLRWTREQSLSATRHRYGQPL